MESLTAFTQQFKAHARSVGADLLGIAPIARFDELPAGKRPTAIFPDARSVVVVGKRIARGALRGVEEGTQFELYQLFGRDWLNNRVLATATFRTAEFLEEHGWEAAPLPNLPPETPPMGIAVRPHQPPPNVMLDFDDAAVRAGLGEIGRCGWLLTPQFGPRQRVQLILTDAELEADPLLKDAVCDHCLGGISVCPLGALSLEQERALRVSGKEMRVAEVDYAKCQSCRNGAEPNRLHPAGKPDRLAAACARACLHHLEERGRLANIFHNPFRKRPAWAVVTEQRLL
jgi:epoxyqueuosine reductase QueG